MFVLGQSIRSGNPCSLGSGWRQMLREGIEKQKKTVFLSGWDTEAEEGG